jgi:GT2 family glycosyltransferase
VAAVGPGVLDSDGSVFSLGGQFDPFTGVAGHLRSPGGAQPYEVPWVDGSCFLVSVNAARQVGGLATEYFMYWEETDWCVRARRSGYSCLVVPSTNVIHHRGSANPSRLVVDRLRRNAVLFMRRNGSLRGNMTSIIYFATIGLAWESFAAWRRGENVGRVITATGRALRWNMRDALSRRRWRLPSDGPPIAPTATSSGPG